MAEFTVEVVGKEETVRKKQKQLDPRVLVLVLFFGGTTWIDVTGLFVELPLLVHSQPEGWNLPSYFVIIIQSSLVAPLAYTVINKLFPGDLMYRETVTCFVVIIVGCIATLLLVFLWSYTASIGGKEHSVALLTLVIFLSLKATVTNVVYFPFMMRFKEVYMPVFVAGESIGGLLVSIFGLLQGPGGHHCKTITKYILNETADVNFTLDVVEPVRKQHRFSVSVFFGLLFVVEFLSLISFFHLNYAAFSKKEIIDNSASDKTSKAKRKNSELHDEDEDNSIHLVEINRNVHDNAEKQSKIKIKEGKSNHGSQWRVWVVSFLCLIGPYFIYGLEPGTTSYACLPFGQQTYNLGVKLRLTLSPVAALMAMFVKTSSLLAISSMMGAAISLVGFQLYLASQSPSPPLQNNFMGPVIVVGTLILIEILFTYAFTLVACVVRAEGDQHSLMYAGFVIQFGTTLGGVTSFLLVSVIEVFEDAPPCPGV